MLSNDKNFAVNEYIRAYAFTKIKGAEQYFFFNSPKEPSLIITDEGIFQPHQKKFKFSLKHVFKNV